MNLKLQYIIAMILKSFIVSNVKVFNESILMCGIKHHVTLYLDSFSGL